MARGKSLKKCSSGFSLIEVVIAIAVLSILVALTVPTYFRYVASAKATAGKFELDALKTGFEGAISSGDRSPTLAEIGGGGSTTTCNFSFTNNPDGTAALACTLLNPPYLIAGGIVTYLRSSTGTWTCQVNASIGPTYAPNGCTVGG